MISYWAGYWASYWASAWASYWASCWARHWSRYRACYQANYQASYQASYDASYWASYWASYRSSYEASIEASYRVGYRASNRASYNASYHASYRASYHASYHVGYQAGYQADCQHPQQIVIEVILQPKIQGGLDLSILGGLPPELIIHTTRFLPPESAASFALCCHSIYAILGTRHWKSLRTRDQQRLTFLTLLERDLPKYIFCHPCKILHLSQKESDESGVCWDPSRPLLRPCAREEFLGGIIGYIHPQFSFSTFQMAMKRYRLGLPYSDYLSRLGHDWTSHGYTSDEMLPYQSRAQAKIVARSLILRIQYVLLIPLHRTLQIPRWSPMGICPHIEIMDLNARMLEDIQCKVEHNHSLRHCSKEFGLKQCYRCTTEYQVNLRERGQLGSVIVITKWLDLGEGRLRTDFKWRSHLNNTVVKKNPAINTYLPKLGSIRNSFEQNEPGGYQPFLGIASVDELCRDSRWVLGPLS
jgi:hypothetical protein